MISMESFADIKLMEHSCPRSFTVNATSRASDIADFTDVFILYCVLVVIVVSGMTRIAFARSSLRALLERIRQRGSDWL
jgi:hypothetical protein